MKKLSRRAILSGAAGVVGAGAGLEWWSLRGNFDHRRSPGAIGVERYEESLRALAPGTEGVIHIGHSTHLIALGGRRFLTDPWFYDPAFGALSHTVAPAVLPSALGPLDAILVSHDHADHADLRAMAEMDKRASVVVATEDLARRVSTLGFGDVSVLKPGEAKTLGEVTIVGTTALHDIYEIGFVLKRGDISVYFAGDTALVVPALVELAKQHAPRVAILPCDGTRLAGGKAWVMTPDEAAIAAGTLGASVVVPSHAQAYFSDPFVDHVLASTVKEAPQRLAALLRDRCKVPAPGELLRL